MQDEEHVYRPMQSGAWDDPDVWQDRACPPPGSMVMIPSSPPMTWQGGALLIELTPVTACLMNGLVRVWPKPYVESYKEMQDMLRLILAERESRRLPEHVLTEIRRVLQRSEGL